MSRLKQINYPKINEELAEFLGIVAGDGHLSEYISKRRTDYKIVIYGNKELEIEYFKYLTKLIGRLFKITSSIIKREDGIRINIHSKELLYFINSLGIPIGNKTRIIRIPKIILNNDKLAFSFLRGLADADFGITFKTKDGKKHHYPRICAQFASKLLIEDIKQILDKLSITYYYYKTEQINFNRKFTRFNLDINGRKNLQKWMELIGFNNKKHLDKIKFWKENGYYPPQYFPKQENL